MPVKRPTDTDQIESLLRGELPPAEAERLATQLADDSRVAEVAEKLPDDTLMSDVKNASTSTDPDTEHLAARLAERLKPASAAPAASVTLTALPSTDAPVLLDDEDEPMPAALEYFKIDRVLGRGGMGTVYLADDTRLGRKVAVKTLKASVARKSGAKERFLREARLAAALEHECVVPIYYVGEAGGIPFLAMPLLKGQGLDEYLASRGGKLPLAEAVRVGAQVATGLAAAHAAGLIHRDIKPSNIWVDAGTGRVRILDFGLARTAGDDLQLTASGMIVGTPAYMPPEQARGRGVDHRADLFSLGVVLYQMLVGRRPFIGNDAVALLSSLALDTPTTPRELNPEVPPAVSALVMKLLEKDPANRPQSAAEVAAALTPPMPVAVVPRPWREAERTEFDFSEPAEPKPKAKEVPATKTAPPREPGRKLPVAAWVALGVLLLAGGAAAVYQFAFGTKDGTLIVEVAADADVRFKNGKLEVYDESGKKLYTLEPSEKNKTLPPGKYRVKVVGADGVKLDTETFEIERKGKAWVKVTAAPPQVAVVDPKKPDPVKPVVPGTPGGGLLLFASDTGAEAPAPALDTRMPWTAEAYFTPLTENFAKTNCRVIGCDQGFGIGVRDGKYFVYSSHGETLGGAVKAGERVHVACVQTETKRLLFLNGKLAASTDNPFPDAKQSVGKLTFWLVNHVPNQPPIDVLVEGVRISQAVRYTKDFTPPGRHVPDKETLALYHCDEGTGDKLTDSSGNNLHGKIANAKWGKAPAVGPAGPGDPVTLPPFTPGVPLALRKPTWTPGPADNILPGLVTRPAILDAFGRWQIVPTAAPALALAFSPDGKWMATADLHHVRIYDAATGEFKALVKRTDPPNRMVSNPVLDWSLDSKWVRVVDIHGVGFNYCDLFAPDGTRSPIPWLQHVGLDSGWNPKFPAFACCTNGAPTKVSIFDPAKDKPVEVEVGELVSGAWAPDGEKLLVVLADKTGVLVGRDGKLGTKFAIGFECIQPGGIHLRPEWSADGKLVAAPTADGAVGIWNTDGKLTAKTGKHDKPITGLSWRPDGKLLAVADQEGARHFWTPDGKKEATAETKFWDPRTMWAKDGKGFFAGGRYWSAVGNPSFTNLITGLDTMAIPSPDQKSVAIAKRGEIVVTEWKDGEAKDIGWKIRQSADGVPWWSADGTRLVVSDADGVSVYDARDPKKVIRLGGGTVSLLSRAAFAPKGDRLAVANNFGNVFVCEPTGKVLRAIPIPSAGAVGGFTPYAVHDLQWHPDGKFLAVTTGGTTVTVFDTETGKAEASTSVAINSAGGGAIFSPANPDHLLIHHLDAAALWRWKVEKEPQQKFDGIGKLVPSPDGKRFLSLTPPNRAGVPAALVSLDLKDRDTAGTKDFVALQQHPGPSLAWHPDGKHLVVTRTGVVGGAITIRTLDGKVVEEIKPEGIDVTWLEWVEPVAKRNTLVGRQNTDVYLFDLSTKKLTPAGKVIGELTVSPDGKHLIAMEGSALTYWNLDTKAVEQKVVLLPGGEFVTLSAAGEVLEKSANADNYYRYLIEDKTGKLVLKTPAEVAPSLPKPAAGAAPLDAAWLKAVAALPPEKQVEAVRDELKKRNPGFDGSGEHNRHLIDGNAVVGLEIDGTIADISPVRALVKLQRLEVRNGNYATYPLTDLSPLRGLPLTDLNVRGAQVSDLSPLSAMPLKSLNLFSNPVSDLTPLKNLPLKHLTLRETAVADLTPLTGMKLTHLDILDTRVTDLTALKDLPLESFGCSKLVGDLSPLKGMKLKELQCQLSQVSDLTPLKGMPLESFWAAGSKATDLTPIKDAPIKTLVWDYDAGRDRNLLEGMKALETINGKPAKEVLGGK